MRKRLLATAIGLLAFTCLFQSCKKDTPTDDDTTIVLPPDPEPEPQKWKHIPPSPQRNGDPVAGYDYLVYGDYLDSGIPYDAFVSFSGAGSNRLNRTGDNAALSYSHNAVTAPNGVRVVTTNCLNCHSQMLNGELVVGLGNATSDYTKDQSANLALVDFTIKGMFGEDSPEWEAYSNYSRGLNAVSSEIVTEVRGVNPADKLSVTLSSYLNKHDLTWLGKGQLPIPEEVVPSDVPAWWLLRKKNAMFSAGSGRGDFARIMMASGGLTMSDSTKAREIDNNFDDVLAFINTIEPPTYPELIEQDKVARGEQLFNDNCARCHGTYGDEDTYPNLLISLDEIGTDPALTQSNFSYIYFADWYNTSWFGKGEYAANFQPTNGYVAQPLDGVWATAPYLHNGSVPTIYDVLNSTQRPEKWKRSFSTSDLDFKKVGWVYERSEISGSKIIYDTTLPGYGNQGHIYGDQLTDEERFDVIEYLKTL